MPEKTIASIQNAVKGLRTIREDIFQRAFKNTAQYFLDSLIIKHFTRGYGSRQGWKPNSPAYENWKRKKHGTLPQLVLSGSLRAAARHGTVRFRGRSASIRWQRAAALKQGRYQLRKKRTWNAPDAHDQRILLRVFKRELIKIYGSKSRGRAKVKYSQSTI